MYYRDILTYIPYLTCSYFCTLFPSRCYYPRRFRGLPVVQLDRSEFSCSYYSRYQYALALALVSLVTVLFVVITAGLIYR